MQDGLRAHTREGVLYLTIDTPRSPVNVFTPQAGARLVAELQRGLARGIRAVVVRSDKPASFVNGVGLLLAASSRSEHALAQADRIRTFYAALADAPVPTIAAIRGNCFGCGLELALACDLRIAEDVPSTRFRMPEVSDYAFTPLFGGTQRLPRVVGVERAMDLIAFGAHWRVPEALEAGLVDELAGRGELEAAVRRALGRLRQKPPRKSAPPFTDAARRRVLRRIEGLPPDLRRIARRALALTSLPARRGHDEERGMRAELEAFRSSIASRAAANGMAFFFLRQAAKARAVGSAKYGAPRGVRAVVRGIPALEERLSPQPRTGRAIVFSEDGRADCTVAALPRGKLSARMPLPDAPIPPVELAADGAPAARVRDVFLLLEDAGFDPVVTRARGSFLSDRMLAAGGDAHALAQICVEAIAAGEATRDQAELLACTVGGFPLWRGGILRATGRS